jgi:molecular chaperone Hsp33
MDRILRATAGDGFIKMSAVSAKDLVQRAKDIHDCTPTTAAALGRTLCAASMLGNMMKEDDGSLTIRINGGGPIGSVFAVSDSAGFARGYVTNPSVELPLRSDGKLNVGGAVGTSGTITVSRDIGLKEPYIGSTELVSGEIAEDLTAYMLESEQIPAACGLGVLVDTDLSIKSAGGFIVQLMPGASDKLIDTLEENITMMDALTTILAEDGLEAVFEQVLKGLEHHIVGEDEVGYRCKCSRERVSSAILGIGKAELEKMISDGKDVDVSCQFCDTVYNFTSDDIAELLKNAADEE